MFLLKGVLKIRTKFTGEHPWRSVMPGKCMKFLVRILKHHRRYHLHDPIITVINTVLDKKNHSRISIN